MSAASLNVLPSSLPVTQGSISEFAENAIDTLLELWNQHGEVAAFQEGSQRIHFAFGPTYTKQVLSDSQTFHSRFFAVRGPKKSAQRRVTSGLLQMNGTQHKEHRRIVMGPFQRRAISAYHDTITGLGHNFIDQNWKFGEVRDLGSDMTHYMLQLTSSLLFGIDMPEMAYHIGELTERWISLNHKVGPAAFSAESRSTEDYEQLLKSAEELEVAVKEMVRIRRSGKMGFDVLSLLMRAHDSEIAITDEELVGHIVLLFSAAHLTSAHSLTWTLFLLAQHPEIMHQLYQDMQANVAGDTPKAEEIEALPFLEQVLKESMRVMPASAYSQRVAVEPTQLGPFNLQVGDIVVFSQFITHRIPHLYPQSNLYIPSRWNEISPSPYAFLPFGAGHRMCLGSALGMMQLKISLTMFLKRFKLTLVPGSHVDARIMSTMMYPSTAIPVKLSAHDGHFERSEITGNVSELVPLGPSCRTKVGSRVMKWDAGDPGAHPEPHEPRYARDLSANRKPF